MLTIDDIDKVGVLVFDMHLKIRVPVVEKAESTITAENMYKVNYHAPKGTWLVKAIS